MKTALHTLGVAFVVIVLATSNARSAEGGYSNYVPGTYGDFGMALAPTEKWTLRNDFYFYDANASRSVLSGDVVLGIDLEFLMNFTMVMFKPGAELFGAQYATGIFVRVVDLDIGASLSGGGPPVSFRDGASGLGDVALIPIALFWSGEKIHTSVSQTIVVPSGDYDIDNSINTGLNYWSFDTNLALTYLNPGTGRDFSFNIGHIYNTENDDTNYQTGQELHLDVAFNQFFSETFAVGLHGFYLEQITGDSGSGALLGDFEAESAGIGPGLFWNTNIGNQNVSFIAKWLHEFHAESRLEGDHFFLSVAADW